MYKHVWKVVQHFPPTLTDLYNIYEMIYAVIFVPVTLLIIAVIVGWKMGNKRVKKHIRETPYLNRRQMKAIFKAMGVQITEQQMNQMENSFKKAGEDKE